MRVLLYVNAILFSLAIALPGLANQDCINGIAKLVPKYQPEDLPPPRVIIVSAPSGAGKTTIINKLIAEYPKDFFVLVSTTTRKPRPGEVDGKDYHFITATDFQAKIANGDFLEWGQFAGNYYGTSKVEVDKALTEGKTVILNIDVNGAAKVKGIYGDKSKSVFIMPPDEAVLEARLRGRGTETEEAIQKRLAASRNELKVKDQFDSRVVNDDLDKAVVDFKQVLWNP